MNPRRILFFKPGAIGDLLQLSPVVRALKGRFPEASISLVVGSRSSIDLYRFNPMVDEIIVYDKRGEHRSWGGYRTLWRELRRRRFDLVLNYQRSNLKGWGLISAALPARVLVYHKDETIHAVDDHLRPLRGVGIDPSSLDRTLFMGVDDESRRWGGEILEPLERKGGPIVALNPGASHQVNRWPVESWGSLAERLARSGVAPILVGGPDDRHLADGIMGSVSSPLTDLVGKTTLLQLAAILERSTLLVSGDTGPMHMATAVGTRVVAIFGAADPARTGPVGGGHRVVTSTLSCVPCRSRACRHVPCLECMTMITVDTVTETVLEMLRD
ncbi:MAG: lipopolysaccharide heptosyltransferase II [Desulfuromonadia bacterium]